MSKLEILRWFLFIPGSIAGFYLALIIMITILTSVESLCPVQYIFVGEVEYCLYPKWVYTLLEAVGGALAAFLVVFIGSIVAPGYKHIVPYLLFLGGAVVAFYWISSMGDSVLEYLILGISTLLAGIATAVMCVRRSRL